MNAHHVPALLLILEFSVWGPVLSLNNGDACKTPYKENATCIPFYECKVIFEAIDNPLATSFIQKSECGVEGDDALVCCGSKGFIGLTLFSPTSRQKLKVPLASFSNSTICGTEKPIPRISGGSVTDPDEFPWMVALEMTSMRTNKTAGIKCGGSLISHRHVLTAAHCIVHVEFVIYRAWLGAWNVESEDNCYKSRCSGEVQKLMVEKAMRHKFFDFKDFFNDIALLKLEKRVEFNEYIKPICLPDTEFDGSEDGARLTVSGWGVTENHTTSDVKLKVEVPKTSDDECINLLKYYQRNFTSSQLCAGGEVGKDSCQGDSGGPLMRKFYIEKHEIPHWYQEGLVSYGIGCAEDIPAVYTRIYKYIPWIEQTILELTSNGDPCQTPNKENGTCILFPHCNVIIDALKIYNPSTIKFVQDSQCGTEGNVPLVCCGSVGFPKSNMPDKPTLVPNTTTPPNSKLKVPLTSLSDSSICGTENSKPRIIGGMVTEPDEFPWMVALEMMSKKTNNTAGIKCTGSLINHQYVLTAAHCIVDVEFKMYRVWLGLWNIASEDNCYDTRCAAEVLKEPVEKAIPHHLYIDTSHNIGLVKLQTRVEYTEFIKPICLPALEFAGSENGARFTIAGWGGWENNNATASSIKHKLEMLKLSTEECTNYLKFTRKNLNSDQLCAAGEPGKDFCGEDIGGPVMRKLETGTNEIRWYQEGLLSYGFGCGRGYPKIYTKINDHIPWIESIMKEQESSTT